DAESAEAGDLHPANRIHDGEPALLGDAVLDRTAVEDVEEAVAGHVATPGVARPRERHRVPAGALRVGKRIHDGEPALPQPAEPLRVRAGPEIGVEHEEA